MYRYKRAVGIRQLAPRGEELLDIGDYRTADLVKTFSALTIVIYDELYFRDVAIDLMDYRNEFLQFPGKIQDWLDMKANTPLITHNKLPGNQYRYVQTHDIQYRWFSLLPGDARISDDRQGFLDTASARDIRVVKTDRTAVNYPAMVDRSLWVMNGHMVRAVADDKAVYLLGAGAHFNVNDNIHVNCLNFATVSTLKTYPIEAEQIEFEEHPTWRFLHVRAPVSLIGKKVWMSIGGRLYMDDVIEVVSEHMVRVNMSNVDWFTRIFDSKAMIDLSAVIDKEREVVNKDFFKTPSFWEKLLTDLSSFFIVLDNPNLHVTLTPIVTYKYPFTYHTEETQPIPLLTANGLLPKYFTRKIINRRLLDIDIGLQRLYVNKTTGSMNGGNVLHGYTNRFKPSKLHKGYLLYIRSVVQED